MVAMDLVKGLHQQINILKSEVYFLRQEPREKSNLLKIMVKSTFPETVDGFVQEQKQQNSLITTKEKEYCTTDTDDNTSINNHTINNKGSHKNNNNINIKSVKWSKAMKINNDGFKIKDNKNDNYNNLDIKKIIINNIDSKYDSNIKDNNIDNKNEGHTISRNSCGLSTNTLTLITIARKSPSTVMMVAKTSTAIPSTMTTKEKGLIVTPRTQKTKSVRQKIYFYRWG